jgi:hypothetical protein
MEKYKMKKIAVLGAGYWGKEPINIEGHSFIFYFEILL